MAARRRIHLRRRAEARVRAGGDDWIEATGLEVLRSAKTEIVSSHVGGMDVDFDTILEELGEDDPHVDESVLLDRWFDVCMDRLQGLFREGRVRLYRAVSVDDPEAFARLFMEGEDVGQHWTYDRDCASTSYHGGPACRHDVLLTGWATPDDVCWGTTIQMLFGHPHEREINIRRGLVPISLIDVATGLPPTSDPVIAA